VGLVIDYQNARSLWGSRDRAHGFSARLRCGFLRLQVWKMQRQAQSLSACLPHLESAAKSDSRGGFELLLGEIRQFNSASRAASD
jgi:hypothetical protein